MSIQFIQTGFEKTVTMATSWEDMTADQIAHVLALLKVPPLFGMANDELLFWKRVQIFKTLTDWTDKDLLNWQVALIADEMADLGCDLETATAIFNDISKIVIEKYTAFMFHTEGRIFINPTLYTNPLPTLKMPDGATFHKGKSMTLSTTIRTYVAAESSENDPLSNCTLEELSRLFTLYEAYQKTNAVENLHTLIAVLYRPRKPRTAKNVQTDYDDDERQPLEASEKGIARRANLVAEVMPPALMGVIELHIVSCRARFVELYPELFKAPKSTANTQKGDWLDLILELADYDPTKKDLVMQANAHDMLTVAVRAFRHKQNSVVQTPPQ